MEIAPFAVGPSSAYAGAFPPFKEPKEVACYSRDGARAVSFDWRSRTDAACRACRVVVGGKTGLDNDGLCANDLGDGRPCGHARVSAQTGSPASLREVPLLCSAGAATSILVEHRLPRRSVPSQC